MSELQSPLSSEFNKEEEEENEEEREIEKKNEEKESKSEPENNFLNNVKTNINKKNDILKEDINNKKDKKVQKLMVMVIPKTNKDLPLPLNTLYFFLELFSYEYNLKQLTDEDNKLVFYLMNINWLNELKIFYNYKCIEFIIKKELKENKNFLNRINDLLNISNPSKLYEDYKLINKFNNIIINPKKIKKNFVDKEELFAPKKVEYDVININKNIVSSQLDYLDYFTYYPKCVLINERMRNILYLEYKYLKFSQFQKGDITLVDDKIYIKLTNKIIEVCSFETKNLIITPIYILYYFDISNVPFWENVLYEKDFLKDYLLKRIHKDNKHIQCMLDPFNKEYIGYAINLNIPYKGEKIKEYAFINENISNYEKIPNEEELKNNIDIISKFNLEGFYKNKFEENEKKNKEDDTVNQFMLKMKYVRKKKEEEIFNKKKKYIETLNKFNLTKKTNDSIVNVNGEIIGFVQGDDLTKNGEGFIKSNSESFISSTEYENRKRKLIEEKKINNNINNINNNDNDIYNIDNPENKNNEDFYNDDIIKDNIKENNMNEIKEEGEYESENDYNGEIIMEKYKNQLNKKENKNNSDYIDNYQETEDNNNEQTDEKKKGCLIF